MQKIIITLINVLLLFSCGNKKSDVTTQNNQTEVFNVNPNKSKKIESIDFERTTCYGTCPAFRLSIYKNDSAVFKGLKYTKFIGNAKQKLPENTFYKLESQIIDMNIKELQDNYSIDATDNATAILVINFDDGTRKRIIDYGLSGTPKLKKLYTELTKIGTTTNWKAR